MASTAKAATFDPAAKERRVMIAKIHVAKKEMALGDDDYRAMLIRVTGRASSADCSPRELRAMVEAMKAQGFRDKPRSRRVADHPAANKARAMWISLYHLGAIDNPAEEALEAIARRQLKVERLQWANQAVSYKLIEALKAIAQRHGWDQRVGDIRGADAQVRVLKLRLVDAIVAKLVSAGLVPVNWSTAQIAARLAGMERPGSYRWWDLGDLDLLAKALGAKLRDSTGGQSGGLAPRENER